jgi:hypothetical protein
MNNNNPKTADAPVPLRGTEQTADQAAKQQQPPPPAESGTLESVSNMVEGVADVASIALDVLSIFE